MNAKLNQRNQKYFWSFEYILMDPEHLILPK